MRFYHSFEIDQHLIPVRLVSTIQSYICLLHSEREGFTIFASNAVNIIDRWKNSHDSQLECITNVDLHIVHRFIDMT